MTVVDQLSFSKNALNQYAQKIGKLIDSEIANEESFYADFRDLLKKFFKTDEFEIVIVPKSEETADKPDFIVYMDNIPIIHIEGKNPYDPVDKWLLTDTKNRLFNQVYRFRGREDNNIPVIATDFIHIWIVDKDTPNSKDANHQVKFKLKIIDDSGTSWKVYSGIKPKLESALSYVCEDIVLSISKVSSMIPLLVKYAKKLKEKIIEVFIEPSNPMRNYLENIRNDFLDSIFSSDKEKKTQEFADLFAQTLIYGGFIAWMRFCKEGNLASNYSFKKATDYLPYGTFIYDIFADMATKSSPDIKKNIFNKIERIFQSTQFEKITQNTESLMITFYSDFLWQYDPIIAKDRGIVFTPHPIINFIVRGINYFLKKHFNKPKGLIDPDIHFLDPAAGTMGFPCELLRVVKDIFNIKYFEQPGRINSQFNEWVQNSFLDKTYAFEILMAPYVLGHLRTNMLLDELGATFDSSSNSVKLFLFNTLMELQTKLTDFRNPSIGQEIVEALSIRNSKQILVVFSNPPYNATSQNNFDWINKKVFYEMKYFSKMEKEIINKAKNKQVEILKIQEEKNDYFWNLQRAGTKDLSGYKNLKNDYVKFIRFAQWKIKENNFGIVAYITNGNYLDGLIFRGMRAAIRRDFDMIYIVDLHGDTRRGIPIHFQRKGIKTDKNVFGIKNGVAITFFIRAKNHSDENCIIKYIDKWGTKEEKFEFLEKKIENLTFFDVPERIDFEFIPDNFSLRNKYSSFTYIVDIFVISNYGVVTGNDRFISDIDKKSLEERIEKLFEKKIQPKSKSVNYHDVIKKISKENSLKKIIKWNYRGFDERYICYNPPLNARHGYSLMQYLLPHQNNITLILERKNSCKFGSASSFFISDKIFSHKCNEGASGAASYAFPLKVNLSTKIDDYNKPKPAVNSNINQDFKNKLPYGNLIQDEDIFFYIYGIFYSKTYRERYSLGLMEDFPRVPIPDSCELVIEMSKLGKRLAELHLLRAQDLDTTKFPMSASSDYKIYYVMRSDKDSGGNQISDTYDPITQKIYFRKRTMTQIKKEQESDPLKEITWIGGITQEMWNFEIGGRQQLKEWLYARRYSETGRKNTIQRSLNNKELEFFLKMCDTIKKTIELLPELEEIYKKIDP